MKQLKLIPIFIFSLLLISCSDPSNELSENMLQINVQDLRADEINPNFYTQLQADSSNSGEFDASLEEVFHLLTEYGWSKVYSSTLGTQIGSTINNCMDDARGGQFRSVPSTYPEAAWYTYDDTTCDYNCMSSEYIYWAASTLIGAQTGAVRGDNISDEWAYNERSELLAHDSCVTDILQNSQFNLPHLETHLPDGTYTGSTLSVVTTAPSFLSSNFTSIFTKYVYVFNIPIIAEEEVPNVKLLHAANVMAKYLDLNEDGTPDNQAVVESIVSEQAFLMIPIDEDSLEELFSEFE